MWFIILSLIGLVLGTIIMIVSAYNDLYVGYDWEAAFFRSMLVWVLGGCVLFLLGLFVIPATTGLLDNYSTGSRDGYITKVSVTGIVWKTNEAQIQVGTGEMAALQSPFAFSIPDEKLLEKVKMNLGRKVRIKYNQWLLMPFRYGDTNYALTEITILEK